MAKKKKHIPKWITATLIPVSVAVVFAIALLITNVFIPVKYLTAYFVKARKNEKGELRVTYLDVGFGDSSLIELPDGKIMLIDGGDGSYPHELSLLKYLNLCGVDEIDYLICSSVKDEHCGGLAEVVKYKTVKTAFVPYVFNTRITDEFHAFMTALKDKKVHYGYASVGEGYADAENDYFFTFLSPTDKDSPVSEYAGLNSNPTTENIEKASVVTWLQYGETAFAFTSDARRETLKSITDGYKLSRELNQPFCRIGDFSVNLEKCKILSVPAHGGAENTYAPWYDLIKPQCAVLSVGNNFSSYPSLKSLSDVCAYVQPLYTSEEGNIVITATTESFSVL